MFVDVEHHQEAVWVNKKDGYEWDRLSILIIPESD